MSEDRQGALKIFDAILSINPDARVVIRGADTSVIIAKKKELRDYPAKVDSATTVDEIKAVWDTDKLGEK